MEGSRLSLLVLMVWASGVCAQVIPRGKGETLTLKCKYPEEYEDHRKTWCRETAPNRCNPILTTWTTATFGRTMIHDFKRARVISVTVEKLKEEDTGAYWCGVYLSNTNIYIVKRIVLRVSDGLFAQVIPRHPGETVTAQCAYTESFELSEKIWCLETTVDTCSPIASTQMRPLGRTRIEDNKQTGVMSVTVKKLTKEDTGIYWCSVNLANQVQIIRRIDLQVSDGLQPEVIEIETGETLDVQCEYTKNQVYRKTWCRVIGDTYKCVITTPWAEGPVLVASEGRTTIEDNKEQRLISVMIQNLTEGDSGEYWCGVYTIPEDRVLVLKRKILRVSKDVTPTTENNQTPPHNRGTPSGEESDGDPGTSGLLERHIIYIGVGLGFLLLITLIALFYVVWIRRRRGRLQRMKDNGEKHGKTLSADPDVPPRRTRSEDESSFSEMESHEVKYATLTHHGGGHSGDPTYSNVGIARRLAAPDAMANSENVEYASINL